MTANAAVGPADPSRRRFIHIAAGAATIGGAAAVAWPLIDQMNPSSDTLALSSIEVDYTKVALGQMTVVKWRSQPVGIWHRTPAQIAAAAEAPGAGMTPNRKALKTINKA